MARFTIGIDLGTTNTAVAYLDTAADEPRPEVFHAKQIVAAGEVDSGLTLPSFAYLPDANEVPAGGLDLPWASDRDYCVGAWARKNASALPGKTISSAKSWLCAANVDRVAPILPWNRGNPQRQLSPVDAAKIIMEHLRDAWNHQFPDDDCRFEDQDLTLTVPASFDAVARNLTVKAATEAGLSVTLLEEPQAAFYAWLQDAGEGWRDLTEAGDRILVCDIGGGTTDFSLIQVLDEDGDLALERIAVGNHILLGGDNLDLTLAYTVAAKLQAAGTQLDAYQISGLTHACREAKEVLAGNPDAGPQTLTVLGRGSSVIGGSISTELAYDELHDVLVNGFFPDCPVDSEPAEQQRAGLRDFGLDYASDPAITKHLAAFLSRQQHEGEGVVPEAVLFNGGVTKAAAFRDRVVGALNSWQDAEISVLTGTHPDLAVAVGACWYGYVRQGNAIRIKAGSPHSYYVGIESTMPAVPGFTPPTQALCVVPFGMEEGTELDIPYSGLGLVVGASTEFRFVASTERQDDYAGQILPDAASPALHELPALSAELPADDADTPPGTLLPVRLRTVLAESGTLELWCIEDGGTRRWSLEYELRGIELAEQGDADSAG
jgi:molecular chaperone DnaK (HSP70)